MGSHDDLPTADQMVASKFMGAAGLSGPSEEVTIVRIRRGEEKFDGGKKDVVNVFTVRRGDKTTAEVIFCRTNVYACRVLFGEDPRRWLGKRVTLMADLDVFGKDDVECIRISGSPDAAQRRSEVYREAFEHQDGRANKKLIKRLKAIVARAKRMMSEAPEKSPAPRSEAVAFDPETGEVRNGTDLNAPPAEAASAAQPGDGDPDDDLEL